MRKSCQGIICADHRKSFKNTTSASSAPIQANVVDAGFVNVLKILFSGFNKNVLAQLQGPLRYRFRYFPRPFCRRVRTALEKIYSWYIVLPKNFISHSYPLPPTTRLALISQTAIKDLNSTQLTSLEGCLRILKLPPNKEGFINGFASTVCNKLG